MWSATCGMSAIHMNVWRDTGLGTGFDWWCWCGKALPVRHCARCVDVLAFRAMDWHGCVLECIHV